MARDGEPYTIVGGNPAMTIRKRFDDRLIGLLLEMKWWDWRDDDLKAVMPQLTSGEIEKLHGHWNENMNTPD